MKFIRKKYILAHDIGTSGDKATVVSSEGKIISSSFSGYKTYFPKPGWAEQNPEDWWKAVCKTTKAIVNNNPEILKDLEAISFSGQMMGCIPVNKNGDHLHNAIIWSDQRAYKQKDKLSKIIGDDNAYKITGTIIIPNYLASKIQWLKEKYSDIYKNTFKFLQAKDYIVYRLTKNFFTDYSDSSATNLFDIKAKNWSKDILSEIKIEIDKLPQPVESSRIVGKVKKDISYDLGIKSGLPVVIGGADGCCATVGAGASRPGVCYSIFGSSAWNSLTTKDPLYDISYRTFILNHLDPNLYTSVGTMQSAGASFEWLKTWLGSGKNISNDLLTGKAYKANIGSNGALFLPYLMGERSPYWDSEVKGAFLGLTRVVGQKEIIRSIYEGVIFHLKIILDILEENSKKIYRIRLIGGGGKSEFIQRMMADVFGKEIVTMKYMEEATSLGASIAGFIGIGLFDNYYQAEKIISEGEKILPDLDRTKIYDKYFEIFKESYLALKEINHKIHKIIS